MNSNKTARTAGFLYLLLAPLAFLGITLCDYNTLFLRKQTPFQLFSANTGGFYSENASEITG